MLNSPHSGAPPTLIQSMALWDEDGQGRPRWRAGWDAAHSGDAGEQPGSLALDAWVAAFAAPVAQAWQEVHICAPSATDPRALVSLPVPALTGCGRSLLSLEVACTPEEPAAIELWGCEQARSQALALREGWYSEGAEPLSQDSQYVRLPQGVDLPGVAWELASPAYFGCIGSSQVFMRAQAASQSGLHHGLAIPVGPGNAVLALLTSAALPIARRLELVAAQGGSLRRIGGHCQRDGDLFPRSVDAPWGAELLASLRVTNSPVLALRSDHAAHDAVFEALDAEVLLAWPFAAPSSDARLMAIWL